MILDHTLSQDFTHGSLSLAPGESETARFWNDLAQNWWGRLERIPSLEIKSAVREMFAEEAERKQGRTWKGQRDEGRSSCVSSTLVEGPTCSRVEQVWNGFRLLGDREGQWWGGLDIDTELDFSALVFLKYQELLGGTTGHRFPWLCPCPCLGQQDPPMAL